MATPDIWSKTARLREDPQIRIRKKFGRPIDRGRQQLWPVGTFQLSRLLLVGPLEEITKRDHSQKGRVEEKVTEDLERAKEEEMVDQEMPEQY